MFGGNSSMNKRPKPGESEEDILAQEKEFLNNFRKGDLPPAAKVIKSYSDGEKKAPVVEMDVSSEGDKHPEPEKDAQQEIEHPVEDVLFNIKERAFDSSKLKGFTGARTLPKIVPSASALSENKSGSRKAGKSLFARTFDSLHASKASKAQTTAEQQTSRDTNRKEEIGDKIHPLLSGMSEQEILAAQQDLLARLDPQMVNFLKSRSKTKSEAASNEEPSKDSEPLVKMDLDSIEQKFDVADLPINPQDVSKFPRMATVESDKLAWAGLIKPPLEQNTPEQNSSNSNENIEGKSARFDFHGDMVENIIPDNSTYNKGLHCHGEEMERAGYSLEELLTLMRSLNTRQRSLAMETIANIFDKAHTGLYDGCFEKSLFQVINDLDFMHAVRIALDHTDATSVNSAMKCLSAIVFPSHEEICLDITYLWPGAEPHPWLLTNSTDVNTIGKDDKDADILESDLLQFLIQRSDLLLRIGFFFRDKSETLNEHGVTGILKILVRIARHSPDVLLESTDIIKYLINNHVSANWRLIGTRPPSLKGLPLPLAFKVIRILADSSPRNAEILYKEYKFFPALMSYLAYFEWNNQSHVADYEDLILECFKVWTAFLSHGLAIDEYTSFFPILIQFLQYYEAATEFSSFDISHASHLFTLLSSVLEMSERGGVEMEDVHSHWPLVKSSSVFISNFVSKMLSIISTGENETTYNDLYLLSVTQGLRFLASASQYEDLHFEALNRSVEKYLKSPSYQSITQLLKKHSVVLHHEEMENTRYPSNVATTGAILLRGKLNPMISSGTPYHFLTALIQYTKTARTLSNDLVINNNIREYLQQVCRQTESSAHCNFFVRFELALVDEILDVYIGKEKFSIAYKMLSEVPVCCTDVYSRLLKNLFSSFVEDKEFVSALFQMYEKSIHSNNETKTKSTSNAGQEKVKKVAFENVPDNDEKDQKILFATWRQKLTKKYWIFEPLDEMYRSATQIKGYIEANLTLIEKESRVILQFILQCLENFKDTLITNRQDLGMVYARVCQIFMLGDPRVYIDDVNTPTLRAVLKALITSSVMANNNAHPIFSEFKPTAEFSASFFDIYADLVREFHDNSYFNELFASFLLLPLRAAEDSRVKKAFWGSEYINCIRLTSENVNVPMNWFTSTIESDQDILKLYWQLYKSGKISETRNPFLFDVIKFHLTSQNDRFGEKCRADFSQLKL